MGLWKDRSDKPGNTGGGKHAKPAKSQELPKMTPKERLDADIRLVDGAYERKSKDKGSVSPNLDALRKSQEAKGGKHKKK